MMAKRIHVVINPASGQDQYILNTINRVFREAEIAWEVAITQKSGDARRYAANAAAEGFDVVAAYGGDGSVMEVAEGLMDTDVPLAILPGGTANLMSVELGIPGKLEDAAKVACSAASVVRQVDMGQADAGKFMLRVGIGFPAEKVILADRDLKDKYGLAAYTIAAFKAMGTTQVSHYQLVLDGEQVEVEGIACRVDNSSNVGMPGVSLVDSADVSDGYLDVIVLRDKGLTSLTSAAAGLLHRERINDAFHHWRAREITIETDPPQPIQGDGEIWGTTPISIKVLPGGMQVLVPGSKN
jgi:YegS/Rv2252/BmrU family lipid kinase